jgi:hypothetical protein
MLSTKTIPNVYRGSPRAGAFDSAFMAIDSVYSYPVHLTVSLKVALPNHYPGCTSSIMHPTVFIAAPFTHGPDF